MKLILGCSGLVLIAIIFVSLYSRSAVNYQKISENSNQTLGISITKDNSLDSFAVIPAGPINPGDSYEITITAKNNLGQICEQCGVKAYFEEPQPGDEIFPSQGRLDDQGRFYTKVTSYVTQDRPLFFDIRTSEENLNTASTVLQYNNNPILSVVRLIISTVSKVGSLPPMGNIYAKAVRERPLADKKREIDLNWNSPFGTRRVDVYYSYKDSSVEGQLLKTTTEKQTSIVIDADKDINLNIRACTVSQSCVDALPLSIPAINSSESGELVVPNYGFIQPYEEVQNFEKQDNESLNNTFNFLGPLKSWLSGLYSSFKE